MAGEVVGIVGMQALRRDIARMSTDVSGPLYRAIKDAGKRAVEPVAARTRQTVGGLDQRPPDNWTTPGRLAATVRTSGTRTGGAVRMGLARVPYAGWVEFGGHRFRPHQSQRDYVQGGRYLVPAAQGLAPVAAQLYADAIGRVLNSPAVWTNTTDEGSAVHD